MEQQSTSIAPSITPEIMPDGVILRDPTDFASLRESVFEAAKTAVQESFPMSKNGLRLEVADLGYAEAGRGFSPQEQTEAVMNDRYLAHRLRGKIRLVDEITGKVLEETAPTTLMRVPWVSERGTIIHNGSEYNVPATVSRLLPGVYTRLKNNGLLEAQINTRMGTGRSMWVDLDPATALFRLRAGGSSSAGVNLYSVLSRLGVDDATLEKAWGPEILQKHKDEDDHRALDRVYRHLVRPYLQSSTASPEEKSAAILQALQESQVNEKVVRMTLPGLFDSRWLDTHKVKKAMAAWDASSSDLGGWALVKRSALDVEELKVLAAFLNKHVQAGIDLGADKDLLETQIMALVNGDPGMVLQAHMTDAVERAREVGTSGFIKQALLDTGRFVLVKQSDVHSDRREARHATALPKSPEQARAGNYKQGRFRWNGFRIGIETAKGTTRKGVDKNGKAWSVVMTADYGKLLGTEGADGDALDVFMGPHLASDLVVVINQNIGGKFDEHKCMIGYRTEAAARRAYMSNYSSGWDGLESSHCMSVPEFRVWVENGDMKAPCRAVEKTKVSVAQAPSPIKRFVPKREDDSEYISVGVPTLLAASEKLLHVNQGLVPQDDKAALYFQRMYPADKQLSERIRLDTTRARRKFLHLATRDRNLSRARPLLLEDEATGFLLDNPLASPLEEINPMQLVEQARRVSRMGPGGIGTEDAITPDIQAVHVSQLGFISPVEGPESARAGADARLSWGVKFGSDGRLYRKFRHPKTRALHWLPHDALAGATIRLPD